MFSFKQYIIKESKKKEIEYKSEDDISVERYSMHIIPSIDVAKSYFKNSDNQLTEQESRFIELLYLITPLDKNGNPINPFVANYKGKDNFALRRWVKDEPRVVQFLEENNIKNISQIFKSKKFNNYHNTSLEKVSEFPNSSEQEFIIALSLNIKSIGDDNVEKSLIYSLFGDDNLTIDNLNDKQKDIYNKYLDYYNNNKEKVKNIAKDLNGFEMEDGELFTKCVNSTGKQDITDSWREKGEYPEGSTPNCTPKTDIISNKGTRFSCKKSTGSQAMSGGICEARATLIHYSHLLSDEDQAKLKLLFNNSWDGKDNERNRELTDKLSEILNNNPKFMMAVIAESITVRLNSVKVQIQTHPQIKCYHGQIMV